MQSQQTTEEVKREIGNTFEIIVNKFESWYRSLVELLPNIVMALLLLIIIWLVARLVRKLFYEILGENPYPP